MPYAPSFLPLFIYKNYIYELIGFREDLNYSVIRGILHIRIEQDIHNGAFIGPVAGVGIYDIADAHILQHLYITNAAKSAVRPASLPAASSAAKGLSICVSAMCKNFIMLCGCEEPFREKVLRNLPKLSYCFHS